MEVLDQKFYPRFVQHFSSASSVLQHQHQLHPQLGRCWHWGEFPEPEEMFNDLQSNTNFTFKWFFLKVVLCFSWPGCSSQRRRGAGWPGNLWSEPCLEKNYHQMSAMGFSKGVTYSCHKHLEYIASLRNQKLALRWISLSYSHIEKFQVGLNHSPSAFSSLTMLVSKGWVHY